MSLVPKYNQGDEVFIYDPLSRKGTPSDQLSLVKSTVLFSVPTGNSLIYKVRVNDTGQHVFLHERFIKGD